MSTNNSIHNQDEIKTEPSSTPPPLALLSFGNILEKFPEFLLQVLSYIPDRIVWNSITSSHKKIYEKSKQEAYPPPWPKDFKLHVPGYELRNPVWSPDGTQLACSSNGGYRTSEHTRIVIFDQRRGLLRFRHYGDENNNNGNEIGWIAHKKRYSVTDLKFSLDGNFLVSACHLFVKIWDYNSTDGYYRQLQAWNIHQELDGEYRHATIIDVSPCCRYIAILYGMGAILKDVQNGKTIRSILLPESECGTQIMFSNIDGHSPIFVLSQDIESHYHIIRIWRPYAIAHENDPDTTFCLINIWERSSTVLDFARSYDNSMIAINVEEEDGYRIMLYSIENDITSTTKCKFILEQSFLVRCNYCTRIHFTPDDKYLSYKDKNGLGFWNINTGRESTYQIDTRYSKHRYLFLDDISFAPTSSTSQQRFLVEYSTDDDSGFYINTKYFDKTIL
jgi:hypothetical protein